MACATSLESTINDPADSARVTLAIITRARPIRRDEMFPDYHDAQKVCSEMLASLFTWPDVQFAASVIEAFSCGDVRRGMQLARERVYFYIPNECNWSYL